MNLCWSEVSEICEWKTANIVSSEEKGGTEPAEKPDANDAHFGSWLMKTQTKSFDCLGLREQHINTKTLQCCAEWFIIPDGTATVIF